MLIRYKLLEVKLPYDQVCRSVSHNFHKRPGSFISMLSEHLLFIVCVLKMISIQQSTPLKISATAVYSVVQRISKHSWLICTSEGRAWSWHLPACYARTSGCSRPGRCAWKYQIKHYKINCHTKIMFNVIRLILEKAVLSKEHHGSVNFLFRKI